MKSTKRDEPIQYKFLLILMPELNKQTIKKFVHDTIHLFRGLAARLAEEYGKSEFWISDILRADSETDGFFYAALLFMKRVWLHSPEAHAMLDDEWRRINDALRSVRVKGEVNETVDSAFQAVGQAYIELITAYRNRQGKGEIKTLAANLKTRTNNFLRALEPREVNAELDGRGRLDTVSVRGR